jgi:hypothetical protein
LPIKKEAINFLDFFLGKNINSLISSGDKYMKKIILVFCFFCCLLPVSLFAEVERWYVYMGAGYSYTMYDGVMKDITTSSTMDKKYAFNWDMVHFYFPIGDSFIVGPAVNAVADVYSKTDTYPSQKYDVNIFQYFFGPSCMYFLGKEIGDGIFFRAEAGLSRLVISYSNSTGSNHLEGSNWGSGWGFLGGMGYAYPITEGTRLLFMLSYSYKQSTSVNSESLKSSSINVTVGVLW